MSTTTNHIESGLAPFVRAIALLLALAALAVPAASSGATVVNSGTPTVNAEIALTHGAAPGTTVTDSLSAALAVNGSADTVTLLMSVSGTATPSGAQAFAVNGNLGAVATRYDPGGFTASVAVTPAILVAIDGMITISVLAASNPIDPYDLETRPFPLVKVLAHALVFTLTIDGVPTVVALPDVALTLESQATYTDTPSAGFRGFHLRQVRSVVLLTDAQFRSVLESALGGRLHSATSPAAHASVVLRTW